MHKKVIAGSAYYYTTKRDDDGRHRTYYLGSDPSLAKKRERELSGKTSGLTSHSSYLYLLLVGLCGLTLLLSGQITGLFTFDPSPAVEFDLDESWNISEALVRVSIGNYSEDLAASDLVAGDKIVLDVSQLNVNAAGRVYADLIVSNVLVESKYVDVAEETAAEEEPDLELLKEEAEQRLESEDDVNVVSVEKQENEYRVTVDVGGAKKGSVVAQVGNVSDVKKVQIISLPERMIQL